MTGKDDHSARLKEAAAWYAELQAPDLSEESFLAFEAWQADPANARAFAEIERTLVVTDRTQFGREAAEGRGRRRQAVWKDWRIGGGAIAAALLVGVLVLRVWPAAEGVEPEVYVTEVGEIRELALSDGSAVVLNTASRLSVEFGDKDRMARLEAGEAVFDVVQDGRVFVVQAGDVRTEVMGTRFLVGRVSGQTEVLLAEGGIRVSGAALSEAQQLVPGQQLLVDGQGRMSLNEVDPDTATRWVSGQVEFDNTRLADAVAEMNRYSEMQLVLLDDGIGEERLSGTFPAGAQVAFAESLELFLPVEADIGGDEIRISARAAE
jgi:transmembrane sensor